MKNGNYQRVLVIESLERLNNSVNGNPAYRVAFTDGTVARTMPDAGWSYEAPNRDNLGVPLLVTFTRGGQIRYANKVSWVSAGGVTVAEGQS